MTPHSSQNSTVSLEEIWSPKAIQLAKDLTVGHRPHLQKEKVKNQQRPVQIRAEPIVFSEIDQALVEPNDSSVIVTKVVHFQRHGQGYHNLLGEILHESGARFNFNSKDPVQNPWTRPEFVDTPLTDLGRLQCRQQIPQASQLSPEMVVVSPMQRAIQTAWISFGHVAPLPASSNAIPWVSHEGCREELGLLTCNRRRPLSEIQADYPQINFLDMTEEDTLWNPNKKETLHARSERIYSFLVDFLANRPESNIAVVGHSVTLFHMCNTILDCDDHPQLADWFLTSEIRSMKLTFVKRREVMRTWVLPGIVE
eukprot:Nitzschia sp. Nitz4//scaffold8_size234185//4242//5201//NITZ4_001225-RA/size234185-processed-gene-0.248-mRNA-1//1//CDS//3329559710//6938//frame0